MNDMPKIWPHMSLEDAHARLTAPGAPFETEEILVRGIAMRAWKHVPRTAADVFALAQGFGGGRLHAQVRGRGGLRGGHQQVQQHG